MAAQSLFERGVTHAVGQGHGQSGRATPAAVLDLTGAWDAGGTAVVKLADLAEWAARQAAERYAARG